MKYSFSGHDKFDCKIDWLSKALRYHGEISVNDDMIMYLGLGSNMIKSLKHWMKVFEIEYLKEFLEKDIFFESLDTLWILHYNLVKNATLYNLFFNKMNFYKFTKEDIFNFVVDFLEKENVTFSEKTIKSDIDVFIRMYNDFFKDLNIIRNINGVYKLNIKGKNDISDKLFLYFLADFIEYTNSKDSISLFKITNYSFSLQKTLLLSESALMEKLYNLKNISNKTFEYNESATLREVYILKNFNKREFLEDVFNEI